MLKRIILLIALTVSINATASVITTTFSGEITANNSFLNTPAIGTIITGGFTINDNDTGGVGSNCIGDTNCWSDIATSWHWEGITYDLNNSFPGLFKVYFDIVDSIAGMGADILTIFLEGSGLTSVKLVLSDSTGLAFEAATISLLPSFSSFDTTSFSYKPLCLTSISCLDSHYYSGVLTSFESKVSAVPLPATIYLILIGLLGLSGRGITGKVKRATNLN